MKAKANSFCSFFLTLGMLVGCGAVSDKVAEVKNEMDLRGHWLMTQSENAGKLEPIFLETDSLVLTFKDGKTAFSPMTTPAGKGIGAFKLLSDCTKGPRPYHLEKNTIVLEAVVGCVEKRCVIQTLNDTSFRVSDPDNAAIVRTFRRIDDATYNSRVKPADQKLK